MEDSVKIDKEILHKMKFCWELPNTQKCQHVDLFFAGVIWFQVNLFKCSIFPP